ncbi:MAG: hypothetical protein DWB56_07940 [Candidatus Jettenia sp.]|uniref:Nucleic acid-binding protein n=1 Tax=Candidatus Jettenia caeni TaxID=247490 RepID=I3IJC6_9BACT|nr:hypothetical protein [Candidatus Jettenia sp. AMX1]MBC6928876.1 hypothetical protein [Candidatus Jettenia sp.]GAB61821.1 hypothetical protein KSU1_C0225 [Candidatus Jettenia caeni]KAA0250879.1 MAG: hypothetical protein EDM77_03475 [Candidatus Jettenia sp. AMX1]MCE7879877.1 hypothetical protein [Candidatus Jettenia sp. AMX1]MCQ3926656.1 hypothetical protein [Candidatus Jettenia sp.]
MGDEEIKAAVADAGPLIHLSEIGGIAILHIFDAVHVPHVVWLEIGEHSKNISKEIHITNHNLPELQISEFTHKEKLEKLHSGEIECLYLCRQINLPILLTDDLAVREAAKSLQITPIGSLGIVIKAYKNGKISLAKAERYISDLYDISSLFVTRAIVELVIEQLHKKIES